MHCHADQIEDPHTKKKKKKKKKKKEEDTLTHGLGQQKKAAPFEATLKVAQPPTWGALLAPGGQPKGITFASDNDINSAAN